MMSALRTKRPQNHQRSQTPLFRILFCFDRRGLEEVCALWPTMPLANCFRFVACCLPPTRPRRRLSFARNLRRQVGQRPHHGLVIAPSACRAPPTWSSGRERKLTPLAPCPPPPIPHGHPSRAADPFHLPAHAQQLATRNIGSPSQRKIVCSSSTWVQMQMAPTTNIPGS